MKNNPFRVTFRGVRGSIPTPTSAPQIQEKLLKALDRVKPDDLKDKSAKKKFVNNLPLEIRGCFGGNTSCVQVEAGEHLVIFDCGSGIRQLGLDLMKGDFGRGQGEGHVFISHTHWDHIHGIPFFVPFYIKGNRFTVYSPVGEIQERLQGQQIGTYFPVSFDSFPSKIDFKNLNGNGPYKIGDVTVTWMKNNHPGISFSFRLEYQGKSVVYSTDAEYKNLNMENLKPTVEFFRDADLLIFDSQYTFGEGVEKLDWGHSSTFIGVDLAVDANVKQVAFFHHEPTYTDDKLVDILHQTEQYLKPIAPDSNLKVFLAYEGLVVDMMKR